MSQQISLTPDGQPLIDQVNAWVNAVLSQNIEHIMAFYDKNVRSFDAVSALQFRGKAAYQQHWMTCMAHCPGDLVFKIDHLEVERSDELAVVSFLTLCGGTNKAGEEQSGWMRATQCYRYLDGQWLIVHEHFSVPFDMDTCAMLMNLTP